MHLISFILLEIMNYAVFHENVDDKLRKLNINYGMLKPKFFPMCLRHVFRILIREIWISFHLEESGIYPL